MRSVLVIFALLVATTAHAEDRAQADRILAKIAQEIATDWFEQATVAQLDTATQTIQTQVNRVLQIWDATGGPPSEEDRRIYSELPAGVAATVQREKDCRANVKCVQWRAKQAEEKKFSTEVVQPMCAAEIAMQDALADIARERANPGGVVSMTVLHDDGETVQKSKDELEKLKPAYVKGRKHAWRGWQSECKRVGE